ncbi:Hypothetical predicted protein, partial [Paramuricea clavata]
MSETNASTTLETKLFQLQLTTKRTDGILAKSEEEPIARHQGTLRTVIGEVENLRLTVEAEKLGRKEDTTEWSEEIDTKISEADSHVRLTKEWLAENKRKLEEMENDEKIKFERLNPPPTKTSHAERWDDTTSLTEQVMERSGSSPTILYSFAKQQLQVKPMEFPALDSAELHTAPLHFTGFSWSTWLTGPEWLADPWVRRFTTNRHRRGPLTSDD